MVNEIGERPWGLYYVLNETENFKLKRIEVNPQSKLSYQWHDHREEIWTCIKGQGLVTLNGRQQMFIPGDVVHIPQGAKHRIQNVGDSTLVFGEVQLGTYFGEDDIHREEDDYGRVDPGYEESIL